MLARQICDGGPTATALRVQLSGSGSTTGEQISGKIATKTKPVGSREPDAEIAQSNPPPPPNLPPPQPKNVARIMRYSDGRLYLPLSRTGARPLTVGGTKAVIKDDLALVRRTHDLPLDNEKNSRASLSGAAPDEGFVVVMRKDRNGNWFGNAEILVDPKSHRQLRAKHAGMYRLTPDRVRALGLEDWSSMTRGKARSSQPGSQGAGAPPASGSTSDGADIVRILDLAIEAFDRLIGRRKGRRR